MSDLFDKNHEFVGFSHCFTCARKVKEELETRIADLENYNAELQSLDALQQMRIEALESAGRLLGAEVKAWRTHTEENYYTNARAAMADTDSHPTAARFVKEAGDGH